jgi:hypothetical protein
MNAKTCFVPIENIHSPAEARRQGGLTMDSPGPSLLLPGPTPTPDPPLPPDPSPFPGPPLPEPAPTPTPPPQPDPSPFPGPPVEIAGSPTLLSCGAGFAHVRASNQI